MIDGLFDKVRPLSARDRGYLDDAARRLDESVAKQALGVEHWARNAT